MGFKFKKGSRVEVWNQLEKPLGSWCCAEIVSGNGRYYHVRYDRDPLDDQAVVKRVPRKAMRPCPPVKSRESWVPGDIVEVFDNSSWKLVEVCGVVGESYYLVRLRGSFSELTAHSSELRLQQCWQDDKWIVIDKDLVISGSGVINKISKEGKLSYQMLQPRPEVKKCNVGCHFPTKDGNDAKGLHWDLSRGINGKLHVSSPLAESYTEARKSRAIEGDGNRRRLISQHAPKLLEKGQCWRLVKLASTGPNDGWDLSPILHFGLWHHFHLILRNGNHLGLSCFASLYSLVCYCAPLLIFKASTLEGTSPIISVA